MGKRIRISLAIVLVAVALFVGISINAHRHTAKNLEKDNARVVAFSQTSRERLSRVVVTLPEGDIVVGLENDTSAYKPANGTIQGRVNLLSKYLVTKFIPATPNGAAPRLDAISPMFVMGDSKQGSMYVVLFQDRGDAAIEKSYIRLGGADVVIGKIEILPPEENMPLQEYRVDVTYRLEGRYEHTEQMVSLPREAIVPVVDGHFDPKGLVTKKL